MRAFRVTLFVALVSSMLVCSFGAGSSNQADQGPSFFQKLKDWFSGRSSKETKAPLTFVELNDWLVQNFDSDSHYMVYFESIKARNEANEFQGRLAEEAALALSLQDAVEEKRCSKESLSIIIDNLLAAHMDSDEPDLNAPVMKLVMGFLEQHADICKTVYPVKFAELGDQADPETESVFEFLEAKLDWLVSSTSLRRNEYRAIILNSPIGEAVADYLKMKSSEDLSIDGTLIKGSPKIKIQQDKVEQVYDAQLAEPCRLFGKKYKSVFGPCLLDAAATRYQYDKVEDASFLRGLAAYGMCLTVVSDKKAILEKTFVPLTTTSE